MLSILKENTLSAADKAKEAVKQASKVKKRKARSTDELGAPRTFSLGFFGEATDGEDEPVDAISTGGAGLKNLKKLKYLEKEKGNRDTDKK